MTNDLSTCHLVKREGKFPIMGAERREKGVLMAYKPYSHIDEIPSGTAKPGAVEGCLVLEGGAFRGLYTQGIIDVLMLSGINFSCTIGVSAGALAGMGYVAGQVGRPARVNIGYRHDDRYIGAQAFLNSRSMLDLGFLLEDRGILEPFDWERFNDSARRFVAVATNCRTGAATYFEKGSCSDIAQAVRASASMPYSTPMVTVDGEPYLDGACSNRIPYEWALEQGFDKIVVVRTRDLAYRKQDKDVSLAKVMYRNYPALVANLATAGARYNAQCDAIEELAQARRIFRFAPSEPVAIGNMEGNVEKLGDLYWLGVYDCFENLEALKSYLEL